MKIIRTFPSEHQIRTSMSNIKSVCQGIQDAIPYLTRLKGEGQLPFSDMVLLWEICRTCSNTNGFIADAEKAVSENADQLLTDSKQLMKDCDACLQLIAEMSSLSSPLVSKQEIDAHLQPLRAPYEAEKEKAHSLWMEYQQMSKRLDFMDNRDPEFATLDKQCDAKKAEYDTCHKRVNELFSAYDKEMRSIAGLQFFDPEFFVIVLQKLSAICRSIITDINNLKKNGSL